MVDVNAAVGVGDTDDDDGFDESIIDMKEHPNDRIVNDEKNMYNTEANTPVTAPVDAATNAQFVKGSFVKIPRWSTS